MAKIIGIDLGTTYSAVSLWDEKQQKPVIIPNLRGNSTTPSVVSINESNEVIVGEDAKQNLVAAPNDTISQVKREMGNDLKVIIKGQEHNPQTISAFILSYLKTCAEKYLSEPVHDAVITVPAYFKEVQKSATRDAGLIAGFNVQRIINEPTAAAIAYGVNKKGDEDGDNDNTYAVYDLGGGTFDVSIIEISSKDVSVVGTGGDSRLGGLDMDEAVMKWALRKIKEKYKVDLSNNEEAKRRLKSEAEDIKRSLVVAENSTLNIPYLAIIDNKPLSVVLEISRPQFNLLIKPLISRSLRCLDDAMASAKEKNEKEWEDLDGIMLVGGPTRLHIINEMLVDKLKNKLSERLEELKKEGIEDELKEDIEKKIESVEKMVKADLNPDEVVAMGASIVAGGLKPIGQPPEKVETMTSEQIEESKEQADENTEVPQVDIYDVTPHSLGIAVEGKKFHKIIEKESVIPVTMKHGPFANAADYTTELMFEVYQGEEEFVAANTKIGEVMIQGLQPMKKGEQIFEVKFHLDINGILSTICTDLRTKRDYEGKFKFNAKEGIIHMSADDIRKNREKNEAQMSSGISQEEAPVSNTADSSYQATTSSQTETKSDEEALEKTTIPDIDENAIPEDWRDYWLLGKEKMNTLDESKKGKLTKAMAEFAGAVLKGDINEIEDKAYLLQDELVSV